MRVFDSDKKLEEQLSEMVALLGDAPVALYAARQIVIDATPGLAV